MSFYVGQLVVCVKEGEWSGCVTGEVVPVGGCVYTVRGVEDISGEAGLTLEEISNVAVLGYEPIYWIERFRPITEQRLAIFRSLLVPTRKEKVEA